MRQIERLFEGTPLTAVACDVFDIVTECSLLEMGVSFSTRESMVRYLSVSVPSKSQKLTSGESPSKKLPYSVPSEYPCPSVPQASLNAPGRLQ